MSLNMTMNEHQLAVHEAETRAYQTVIEFIDRMMPPEPFAKHDSMEKHREWERDTRTLRALKCDILEKYMSAESMRAYCEKGVEQDRAKAIEEAKEKC